MSFQNRSSTLKISFDDQVGWERVKYPFKNALKSRKTGKGDEKPYFTLSKSILPNPNGQPGTVWLIAVTTCRDCKK